MQYRGVAPGRQHHLAQGPRQSRPGTRVVADRRHRLGDRPPPAVQHPRDEHLRRGRRRRARPPTTRWIAPSTPPGRPASSSCAPPATRATSARAASSRPATTPTPSPSAPPTRSRPPTRATTQVCYYSSIGPTLYDEFAKPDLVAPGNHIVSLRAPGSWIDPTYPQTRVAVSTYIPGAPSWLPSHYAVMSGTSASAPVVAGAAALMVQQDPSLTPGRRQAAPHGQRRPAGRRQQLRRGRRRARRRGGSGRHGHDRAATTCRRSSATAAPSCRPTSCCSGRSTPGRSMPGPSTPGPSMPGPSTRGSKYAWSSTPGQSTHGRS